MYSNTPPPSTLTLGVAYLEAQMAEHNCKCGVKAASKSALLEHWEEEYNKGNRHFHCGICMEFFYTPNAMKAHDRKIHPIEQRIECPGCNEQFKKPGSLVEHIERDRCRKIGSQDMAKRREEKLAFARELQRRHFGQNPGNPEQALKIHNTGNQKEGKSKGPFNFSRFVSGTVDGSYGNPSLSSLRPTAGSGVRPNPLSFQTIQTEPRVRSTSEFPPVGGSGNASPPTIPNESSGNPWAQKRNLFPGAPPPSRPTPEHLQAVQERAKNKYNAWSEHDPRNPNWDPSRYYVPLTEKYNCPHDRCQKSFTSVAGLSIHLRSGTHANNWKVQCPMCMRWFSSTAALISHGESQSARCHLRKSEGYRHLLHQATAGIVDTTETNEDGTEKYHITDQARKEWGMPEKPAGVPGLEYAVNSMSLNKSEAAQSKNRMKDDDDEEWKEPAPGW
ncbi:hypothetical protein QBC44DRAFT_98411 [Cladorrhinum sp. PSN332]|nr:hypothetical protein QBC44DRAFT_98411 [Cladorrhinum sp. PSN332]